MARYLRADADRPSARTLEARRRRDLEFLDRIRKATEEDLDRLVWESATLPRWQQIAIARAAARQGAR
jgi:hypothetical protein